MKETKLVWVGGILFNNGRFARLYVEECASTLDGYIAWLLREECARQA